MERWKIELLDEVRDWARALTEKEQGRFRFYVNLLAEKGETLEHEYTSSLGGKLRELRFYMRRQRVRVTYYPATGRRFVLLTVFRKTKRSETAEVERARRAMERHQADEEKRNR